MKKKLLENDVFYLSLFVCVCLVALGGIWLTNRNVDKLANNEEIHLIDNNENEESVATSTESKENLESAKQNSNNTTNKLSFLGSEIVRGYSEKQPTYSETLNVWEVHKGLDIKVEEGQEIKSLMTGVVSDVYRDDEYGMSVKVQHDNDVVVIYSNLSEDLKVNKDDKIQEGQCIGLAGNTTTVESKEEQHIHVEAFKGEDYIDPMSLINN